jgi:hypothetical protein
VKQFLVKHENDIVKCKCVFRETEVVKKGNELDVVLISLLMNF